MGFFGRLEETATQRDTLLCVGLDPQPALLPAATTDVFAFNQAIVDATCDLVCAYKPNLAFYEALGLDGLEALQRTVEYIRQRAPDLLIIGDAKRGDVGNTAEAYARALFQVWSLDAATVNAYGGHDTIQSFLEYHDRGVFIWCRSSNPGAGDIQDLVLQGSGEERFMYEHIALKAREWNERGNVGLVVGATYPREMEVVRRLCPDMPILIPGVGAQEGSLEASVISGVDSQGRRAIISSSRQVLYASRGADFAQAARREAMALKDRINMVLERESKGWS